MKFNSQKAIYLQIVDYLLENILAGQFPPKERIPSVRDMAASMQVTSNTILRAYNYLQDNEIVYNRRGRGYFVAEEGLENTRALKRRKFVKETLPEVFKLMKLLKIDFSELEALYFEQMAGE